MMSTTRPLYAIRMPFPAAAFTYTNFTACYPGARPWFGRVLPYPAVEGWVDEKGEPTGHQEQRRLYATKADAIIAAKSWIDPQIVEVWLC